MTPELKQLITIASRQMEKQFAKKGVVRPMWHAVAADGQEFVFLSPCEDKDQCVAMVHAFCDLRDIVRILFIAEAWTATDLKPGELERANEHGVETLPQREEVLMFAGEDKDGNVVAKRTIIRSKGNGKRATLGPLEFVEGFEGRLANLIPSRLKGTVQ